MVNKDSRITNCQFFLHHVIGKKRKIIHAFDLYGIYKIGKLIAYYLKMLLMQHNNQNGTNYGNKNSNWRFWNTSSKHSDGEYSDLGFQK
jgi:hypothetical protein